MAEVAQLAEKLNALRAISGDVDADGNRQPTLAAIDAALRHISPAVTWLAADGDGGIMIEFRTCNEYGTPMTSIDIDEHGACERFEWNGGKITNREWIQ